MASTAPAPAPPAQDSRTTVIPAATSNPAQGSPTSFTAPLVSAHVWSRRTGLHTSSSVIMPLSQLLMQTYKPAFEVVRAKVRNPNNSKWGNAIFDYNHISTTLLGRTWTTTAEGGLTAPPPPAPAITIPQAALLLEQHDLSIEVYSVANACIFTYPNPKPSHAVAKPAAFLVTLRTPIDQTDLQLPLPHEKLPELKPPAATAAAATCHSTASTNLATTLRSPPFAQGSFAPHATCISQEKITSTTAPPAGELALLNLPDDMLLLLQTASRHSGSSGLRPTCKSLHSLVNLHSKSLTWTSEDITATELRLPAQVHKYPSLTLLDCSGASQASASVPDPPLRYLELSQLPPSLMTVNLGRIIVRDLGHLAACPNLQTFICHVWSLSSPVGFSCLAPLSQCTALQHLDISGAHVSSQPRRELPGRVFEEFVSSDCLEPLALCPALRYLDMSFTDIFCIDALAHCAALQHFDCEAAPVEDFSPLASCKSLRLANLSRCYDRDANDLEDLHRLPSLEILTYEFWNGERPNALLKYTALRRLRLRCESLAVLAPLTNLLTLDFSASTNVDDLSPLAGWTRLQELNCAETGVSDLSPLTGCISLQKLDCSHTFVSDVTPLKNHTRLAELCTSRSVTDLSPLADRTTLVFSTEMMFLNGFLVCKKDCSLY